MNVDPADMQPGEALVIENVEARFAPLPWVARWHRVQDGSPRAEDGPGWDSFDEAVAWAAARAPTIRLATQEAGTEPDLEGPFRSVDIELASPTRPVPDYGGTVVLINVQPWLIASGTFTGYRVGDRYHEREVFTDVDAAIDWSREVADTVVVSLGSSRSEVFSAGSADPVGRPLPRLRARDNSICTWEGNAAAASIKLGLDELNAVVDELLTRQEFSGVAVTAREQTEERVSLSFRVRSARYGEAHALAETFSTTLAGEVARREQPHKKPLVFAVLGKRPAVKLIDA